MTGLEKITTQIIDDAKASAQKAKNTAGKTDNADRIGHPGTDGGDCRPSSIQCRTQAEADPAGR